MIRLASLRLIGLIFFLIVSFALQFSVAQTAGVVGTCDEASLDTALTGGGTITFACSGTIVITTSKNINVDTIMDGSGQNVVIDTNGALNLRIFGVSTGVNFTLNNITLSRGDGSVGGGGGILNDGNVTITNSTFANNQANANRTGGAISNTGTMTISNSNFYGNYSGTGGAAISNSGALTISDSTFSNNIGLFGSGSAIFNGITGVVNITNSTFSGNSGGRGGAIFNSRGIVNITNSTFSDNTAATEGAHLYNSAPGVITAISSNFVNGSCVGIITDGSNNIKSNAPGCPGVEGSPHPPQCQEMLDPTFSAPVGWYCRVLMRDNTWLGNVVGSIPAELIDAGVIIAVDVTYYDFAGHAAQPVDGTHQVCLQGDGRFIFLSSAQSPRQIVEINSVSEGGYTCAWVTTTGTAVLIHG